MNELCCGILRSASSSGSRTQVGDLDLAAQLGLLDWGRSVWGRSIWPLGCGRLIGAFDLAARSGAFGWVRSIWPFCGGRARLGPSDLAAPLGPLHWAVRSGRSIGAARWGRSIGAAMECGFLVYATFLCFQVQSAISKCRRRGFKLSPTTGQCGRSYRCAKRSTNSLGAVSVGG